MARICHKTGWSQLRTWKDLLQHFPAIKAKVWSQPRIIGRYSEFMERWTSAATVSSSGIPWHSLLRPNLDHWGLYIYSLVQIGTQSNRNPQPSKKICKNIMDKINWFCCSTHTKPPIFKVKIYHILCLFYGA